MWHWWTWNRGKEKTLVLLQIMKSLFVVMPFRVALQVDLDVYDQLSFAALEVFGDKKPLLSEKKKKKSQITNTCWSHWSQITQWQKFLCGMADCKLEEVASKVIVSQGRNRKRQNRVTQRANQCLHHNECFLQTTRRMDYFSLCSHGVGDVFIQHFPNSWLFLSDRVCLDREFLDGTRGPCCCSAQICSLFFFSPFLCPSFCVPLLLRTYIEMVGYWSWILCSTESLKSLGVYNCLSMTDLWGDSKSVSLLWIGTSSGT